MTAPTRLAPRAPTTLPGSRLERGRNRRLAVEADLADREYPSAIAARLANVASRRHGGRRRPNICDSDGLRTRRHRQRARKREGRRGCTRAVAPRRVLAQRGVSHLLRDALDEISRRKQQARRPQRPKPAAVDPRDVAAAVEPREHAVDGEAKIRVSARKRKHVGLDRKVLVEQTERSG